MVQPCFGLCNRIRVVLSYLAVARSQGRALHVIWLADDACPGHFLDVFEPLPGVRFVSRATRVDYAGARAHPAVANSWTLGLLSRPRARIRTRVHQLVAQMPRDYTALHVRRTDHVAYARACGVFRPLRAYAAFARAKRAAAVHVAADSASSVRAIRDSLRGSGARVVCASSHARAGAGLRHTSLDDAVFDLFACVYAQHFCGTPASSFTRAIEQLRSVRAPAHVRVDGHVSWEFPFCTARGDGDGGA